MKKMLMLFRQAGFTRNEATVILFATTGILVGGTIKLVQGDSSQPARDFTAEYRIHDSLFIARSSAIDSTIEKDTAVLAIQTNAVRTKSTKKEDALFGKLVNINTAGPDQLCTLPGIGQATAEHIIAYRESTGQFKRIEDIMDVKGIGEKKFEKMKAYISVR